MKKTVAEIIKNKIKTGEIRMKSPFVIVMEKLSLKGGIAMLLGLLVLMAGLLAYWTSTNNDLLFGGYGRYGISSFMSSFPYMGVSIFFALFLIVGLLFRTFDFSYKKPFVPLLVMVFIGIVVLGWIFMRQPVGQRLYQREGYRFQMGGVQNGTMIFGTVVYGDENEIGVRDEDGSVIAVIVSENTHYPFGRPKVNDSVRAVGEWEGKTFKAVGIRVFTENNSPIRRLDGSGKGQGNRRKNTY